MLTPRLRRRLSEIARTPAPPNAWTGVRGGAAAPPRGPSPPGPLSRKLPGEREFDTRDGYESPLSPSLKEPGTHAVGGGVRAVPPPTSLLLMPFDPAALGAEAETEMGRCFRLRLAVGDHLDDAAGRAARVQGAAERMKLAPEDLRFVDIETAGLAAAPLFLIGVLSLDAGGLTLTQYFARGYEEEASLLSDFSRSLADSRMVVTFNGDTFDLPYMRDRSIYHRLPPPLFPDHLDLLPAARRRWRGLLPNCRLQTLEQHVCRRHRTGDVPGEVIPQLYHDFVRTENWPLLAPVFHHNALDLLTLAELLPELMD